MLQRAFTALRADPVHLLASGLASLASGQTPWVWLAQAGADGLGKAVHARRLERSQKWGACIGHGCCIGSYSSHSSGERTWTTLSSCLIQAHVLGGCSDASIAIAMNMTWQRPGLSRIVPKKGLMLQELGHMSRRGHKTGNITTYKHTWLLKTDGRGCVWMSDPIPCHTEGSDSRASVTEVRRRTTELVLGKHQGL